MRYDVIIIGHNFATLAAAAFLAQQGQRVGMFTLGKSLDGKENAVRMVDADKRRYRFTIPAEPIGALGEGELFTRYLNHLGMDGKLPVLEQRDAYMVRADGRMIRREHGFEGLRLTLIRHYPQSKAAIDRFFVAMRAHYEDYVHQRTLRLLGKPHTLHTLMSHFGQVNLETALKRYFDEPALRAEFGSLFTVAGLPLKNIRAVDYFMHWFAVMGTQSYFMQLTHEELIKRMMAGQTVDVMTTPIKAIETEGNLCHAIKTDDGTVYSAQQFLIGIEPDTFIHSYVTQDKGFVSETVAPPFRGRPITELRGTAYVALKAQASDFGLEAVQTFFERLPDSADQVLVVTDQTQLDAGAAPALHGALQVEYMCRTPLDETQFKALLQARLPNISTAITKIKFGPLAPYRGGHHPYYEKQKSLRHLDRIDRFNHLKSFDNTRFIGPFHTPERSMLGQLMIGVEVGNLLQTSLDMPRGFARSMPVEMLIGMATEQLEQDVIAPWHKDIAWRIGPRFCTWSFREGTITLYHGLDDKEPEAMLSCGLETFVQWSTGTLQTEDALKRNVIGISGDQSAAHAFLRAFKVEPVARNQSHRVLGRLSLLISLFLFTGALAWYTHGEPSFLGLGIIALIAIKAGIQTALFKQVPWLDVILTSLVLLLYFAQPLGLEMRMHAWVTLGLTLWFAVSFFWPKLGAWPYWDIDHPYAKTRWFVQTMGGLNLLYALLFTPLALGLFLATDMQAFLGIHVLILGAFLTRNYPVLYARSRIKRRT